MHFSLQVLSPQGIGDHDNEIWQATCLTYCQVSLTLSLLLLAASSLWLATKSNKSNSFVLCWMQKNSSQEQQKKTTTKQDRFPWLNIHHIHTPIRWSYSTLYYLSIKKQCVMLSLILLRDAAAYCLSCTDLWCCLKSMTACACCICCHQSLWILLILRSRRSACPSCSLHIAVTNVAVHHYKYVSINQSGLLYFANSRAPMTAWLHDTRGNLSPKQQHLCHLRLLTL